MSAARNAADLISHNRRAADELQRIAELVESECGTYLRGVIDRERSDHLASLADPKTCHDLHTVGIAQGALRAYDRLGALLDADAYLREAERLRTEAASTEQQMRQLDE